MGFWKLFLGTKTLTVIGKMEVKQRKGEFFTESAQVWLSVRKEGSHNQARAKEKLKRQFKMHPLRRSSLDAGAARSKEVLGGFPEELEKTREITCKLPGPALGAYHCGIKMVRIVMS